MQKNFSIHTQGPEKGIKRHVIADKNGFLIAVTVTIANVHDSAEITNRHSTRQRNQPD